VAPQEGQQGLAFAPDKVIKIVAMSNVTFDKRTDKSLRSVGENKRVPDGGIPFDFRDARDCKSPWYEV